MVNLFDFGIAQEDALTEHRAMNLGPSDKLLCITSGGEVPLNLLAVDGVSITSVDVSPNQSALARLKLAAILKLEPQEAAGFLGYMQMSPDKRQSLYKSLSDGLSEFDRGFWGKNNDAVQFGCINSARFERYIQRFNGIAVALIGKKNLRKLLECDTIQEQYQLFDQKIRTTMLKCLFRVAFHPAIYKNKGISEQGMINEGENNMAEFFFDKFRDFCCSTLTSVNYFFQYTFFNQVLYLKALPEYLSAEGYQKVREGHSKLEFKTGSIATILKSSPDDAYNKFHLSNIGDWMSHEEFAELLNLIYQRALPGGRISTRYIHKVHSIPQNLKRKFVPDFKFGDELMKTDRYPFYKLVPLSIHKSEEI